MLPKGDGDADDEGEEEADDEDDPEEPWRGLCRFEPVLLEMLS